MVAVTTGILAAGVVSLQAPNYPCNSVRGNSVQRWLLKAASAAVISLPSKRNHHVQRVQVLIVTF